MHLVLEEHARRRVNSIDANRVVNTVRIARILHAKGDEQLASSGRRAIREGHAPGAVHEA